VNYNVHYFYTVPEVQQILLAETADKVEGPAVAGAGGGVHGYEGEAHPVGLHHVVVVPQPPRLTLAAVHSKQVLQASQGCAQMKKLMIIFIK
jgi:hypothetical protein